MTGASPEMCALAGERRRLGVEPLSYLISFTCSRPGLVPAIDVIAPEPAVLCASEPAAVSAAPERLYFAGAELATDLVAPAPCHVPHVVAFSAAGSPLASPFHWSKVDSTSLHLAESIGCAYEALLLLALNSYPPSISTISVPVLAAMVAGRAPSEVCLSGLLLSLFLPEGATATSFPCWPWRVCSHPDCRQQAVQRGRCSAVDTITTSSEDLLVLTSLCATHGVDLCPWAFQSFSMRALSEALGVWASVLCGGGGIMSAVLCTPVCRFLPPPF